MADYSEQLPHEALQQEWSSAPGELARREPAHAPGVPTGTGLGKYRILERIRTYHNAVVYKARDMMLDRLVALKQMSPELMDNPTACGNFKKEAQLLARIPKDARHVLTVHELIEDEIGLFIVEEYIHGDWLESLLAKRRIDVDDAYRLLKTAAIGLRDLHANKIVHRDINPGNIMVTRGAQARIANFYSAAQEGDAVTPPVITPKYSAPELLLDQSYDDRVDIYSLGLILYEVCVGRLAMEKHFSEIVKSRVPVSGWISWHTDYSKRLPDPARLNPLVPPGLSSILRQMTAKPLEERYSCIEEVLAALARHGREALHDRDGAKAAPQLPGPARTAEPWELPPHPGSARREELLSSARSLHANTSTHTVQPAAWRGPSYATPSSAADSLRPYPSVAYSRIEARRSARIEFRRFSRDLPHALPITMPAPILPRAAKSPVRKRRHPLVKQIAAAILLVSFGAGGYLAYDHFLRRVPPHRISDVLAQGIEAYDRNDLKRAREQLTDAANMVVSHSEHQRKRFQAQTWLLMVDAKEALEFDQFDKAFKLANEAEKYGCVSQAQVHDLQQLIWSRKDAYKLKADGFDQMRAGNFGFVEQKLDDYERTAKAAGLDPNAMKDKLDQTRKRVEYQKWLKLGEEALAKNDFDQAFSACTAAENLMISSDTRDLRKRILDAQKQSEFLARGDKAMLDEDYNEALRSYEEANSKKASPETEAKARTARAHVLFREAKEAISRGDLLMGEDKLNSSIWNHPLYEAQAKLEKMRSAFDGARRIRSGDHALAVEDFQEAIRIYQEILPTLPFPADALVKKKINDARRLEVVARGERAMKREDWQNAIESFEEAQRLGFDVKVQELLITAKARIP